jgi:hypothetical protein
VTGEVMLRVSFPIDVQKERHERAKALFARPQCLLGAFVIRSVHQRSTRRSAPSRVRIHRAQPMGPSRVILAMHFLRCNGARSA